MSASESPLIGSEPIFPHVVLIAVSSINGYITDGDRPGTSFASLEDHQWFAKALEEMDAIVMGSRTYEASREFIRSRLSAARPRYVCTRHPRDFRAEEVPEQLLFTHARPPDLIASLAQEGRRKIALVGGGKANANFLHAGCVDEIWLTLEPLLFADGALLSNGGPRVPLRLLEHRLLNADTLLLKYAVGGS